jgi:hypothetical protein
MGSIKINQEFQGWNCEGQSRKSGVCCLFVAKKCDSSQGGSRCFNAIMVMLFFSLIISYFQDGRLFSQ